MYSAILISKGEDKSCQNATVSSIGCVRISHRAEELPKSPMILFEEGTVIFEEWVSCVKVSNQCFQKMATMPFTLLGQAENRNRVERHSHDCIVAVQTLERPWQKRRPGLEDLVQARSSSSYPEKTPEYRSAEHSIPCTKLSLSQLHANSSVGLCTCMLLLAMRLLSPLQVCLPDGKLPTMITPECWSRSVAKQMPGRNSAFQQSG